MIQLSNAIIRAWINSKDLLAPEPNRLHILGIRGAVPVGPRLITRVENEPDAYNDCVILFGQELEAYRGSVDPGLVYVQHPLNKEGCAHLCDGGPYPYAIGSHRGHKAVVQNGPLKIWRDRNRNNKQDPGENPHFETGIGLNIHAGGLEVVGRNSAACLNIRGGWDGLPWKRFILTCTQEGKRQADRFKLWLLNGPELDPVIPYAPPETTEASIREGTA